MCPAGSTHVMTTDPTRRQQSCRECDGSGMRAANAMALECGPRMRWLWNAGARYRPHLPSPPLDTVLEYTEAAALRYARTREKDANLRAGDLGDWARTFTDLLRHHLHTRPPPPGFRWPIFSEADAAALARLQRHYVISVTDKSAATFQLICPKYYTATVMADLTSNPQYYQPRTDAERNIRLAAANAAVAHLGLPISPSPAAAAAAT